MHDLVHILLEVKTTTPSSGPSSQAWWLIPLGSAVVALGGLFVAIFKAPYQRDSLSAQASKAALEVFNATVTRLEKELQEAKGEIGELEQRLRVMEQQKLREITDLKKERDAAIEEAIVLRTQIIYSPTTPL